MFKLELFSLRGDRLELTVKSGGPKMRLGLLDVDGDVKVWNCQCPNLIFTEFEEPYEVVKGRIIKFYEDENLNDQITGHAIRKPGHGKMTSQNEEYKLVGTRVISCVFDSRAKTVKLEIAFDGTNYKLLEK
jgi:hypothetical protein